MNYMSCVVVLLLCQRSFFKTRSFCYSNAQSCKWNRMCVECVC